MIAVTLVVGIVAIVEALIVVAVVTAGAAIVVVVIAAADLIAVVIERVIYLNSIKYLPTFCSADKRTRFSDE